MILKLTSNRLYIGLFFAGLAVISATITLLLGSGAQPGRGAAEDSNELEVPISGFPVLTARDFLLYEGVTNETIDRFYLLRERFDRWTDDQINRFWIPPETIVEDLLKQRNDRLIEEILKSVP